MSRWLLFALALFAHSVGAVAVNTAYYVTGDRRVPIVQVFDDGSSIFVQLRDPYRVPAPFVDGRPANFTIRGNFLVLPIKPSFDLRLGDAVASVRRAGGDSSPHAQVFRAVDPLGAPAPVAPPAPVALPAIPAREVRGQIALEGRAGPQQATPSGRPSIAQWPHGTPAARSLFLAAERRPVRVVADGTVRGAQEAQRLREVCTVAGPSRCEISYRGAPSGMTILETI